MSTAAPPPPLSVVLIGWPANRPLMEQTRAALQTQMADAGIKYECDVVSQEEGLATLGPKLQSQRPDVVVIGNGIHRNMLFAPFMEQIIDIVRTSAPQAKLAFNAGMMTTMDAVKRWFPSGSK